MIPGKILAFLEEKGTVAVSGTRDANLIPSVHYVSGWEVEPDKRTIRCSLPEAYTDHLISSLEDNGQFSLTIEQIGSHETYQFKGDYVGTTLVTDADIAAHERIKERFARVVHQVGHTSFDRASSFDSPCERSFSKRLALAPATGSFLQRRNDGRGRAS
jgi:hypothetical protein